MQLQWGKTKKDQPYIKNKPRKIHGVKSSILQTGRQILHFKNQHGFKNSHGLKIEMDDFNHNDPDVKLFISIIQDVWNHEPQTVREQVKTIKLCRQNHNKWGSFDTKTRTLEFCMPDGLPLEEYGQIVRHELDHVFFDHIYDSHTGEYFRYKDKIRDIPPPTIILEWLLSKINDATKQNRRGKVMELEDEYGHEFFAETGQYLYQKEHGLNHYNLINPSAMEKAVKLYNELIKHRH